MDGTKYVHQLLKKKKKSRNILKQLHLDLSMYVRRIYYSLQQPYPADAFGSTKPLLLQPLVTTSQAPIISCIFGQNSL